MQEILCEDSFPLVDYEEGEGFCPYCGSKEVQQRWFTIATITSKKSA
jgi:RNA polymerase subunit RPABC4/transcription elongation factor Spt4